MRISITVNLVEALSSDTDERLIPFFKNIRHKNNSGMEMLFIELLINVLLNNHPMHLTVE